MRFTIQLWREIRCQLVKAPMAAAISPFMNRSDHNTAVDYVPNSLTSPTNPRTYNLPNIPNRLQEKPTPASCVSTQLTIPGGGLPYKSYGVDRRKF